MTRVSESRSSPSASPTCSEPAAPTELRSESRCSTATLATPWARDSFQDACSHRATPRLARIAQASSTTTSNGRLRIRPRRRARAACSQAVAQAMSTPRAASVEGREVEDDQRARTGRARWSSARRTCPAGRRGPAGAARARRPARPRAASRGRCGSRRPPRPSGSSSAATTRGRVGTGAAPSGPTPSARSTAARSRGRRAGRGRRWPARPAARAAGARAGSVGDAARPASPVRPRRRRPGSSGLSRTGPPGAGPPGVTPQSSASAPYSPFGSTTQARRPNTAWRHR